MSRTPWMSLHVHYYGDQDSLLVRGIAPCLESLVRNGLCRDAFFVRYWNGGPHIRLRVRPVGSRASVPLLRALLEHLESHIRRNPGGVLDPDVYRRQAAALDSASAALENDAKGAVSSREPILPLQPPDAIRRAPYRFEWQVYGGWAARAAVESQFCQSSMLALQSVRHLGPGQRLALSLRLMAAGASALAGGLSSRISFFAAYFRTAWPMITGGGTPESLGYRSYFEMRETVLEAISEADPEIGGAAAAKGRFERWRRQLADTLCEVRSRAAQANERQLLVAMLHMHENRLGVPLGDELYLSWLLENGYCEAQSASAVRRTHG